MKCRLNTTHISAGGELEKANERMLSFIKQIKMWDWFSLILPALACSPLLYLECWFLWEKEHLQFFPLAFLAAAWFLFSEGKYSQTVFKPDVRSQFAFYGACIVICITAVSLIIISPWLAHFSLVFLVFFWALYRLRNLSVLRISGICGLMLVTIPPPFGLDQKLVSSLQTLSSNICSRLMDATSILHVKRGNVMEIASKSLFVEEACSGVDSQYALMAVAGVLLLLGNTGFIVSLLTIVTVPIWAILGNLLRIYSIAIGLEIFGIDLSVGHSHTLLGLIVFAIAAWAHWSSVQFLVYMQHRLFGAPEDTSPIAKEHVGSATVHEIDRYSISKSWFILPCIAILFMPAGFLGIYNHFRARMPSISNEIADRFLGEDDLPRVIEGQTRVGFAKETRTERNQFGQHSHIWTYQGNGGNQIVSLDFVFRDWHALWICYRGTGWRIEQIQRIDYDGAGKSPEWNYFEVIMSNGENEHGCLHFGFFDEIGLPFSYSGPIDDGPVERPRTFLDVIKPPKDLNNSLLFQVQILSKSLDPIPESQILHQRKVFEKIRNIALTKSLPVLSTLKGIR